MTLSERSQHGVIESAFDSNIFHKNNNEDEQPPHIPDYGATYIFDYLPRVLQQDRDMHRLVAF